MDARTPSIATPPAWVRAYVGLPFKALGRDRDGVDCWGLVRLVLAERFGIQAPSYVDGYGGVGTDAHRADIERLVRGALPQWRQVPAGDEREGDAILLRIMGRPIHVGLVVAPGWMLHVEDGIDAALERYTDVKWSRRVLGIYRWAGAPA